MRASDTSYMCRNALVVKMMHVARLQAAEEKADANQALGPFVGLYTIPVRTILKGCNSNLILFSHMIRDESEDGGREGLFERHPVGPIDDPSGTTSVFHPNQKCHSRPPIHTPC